MDFLVNSLIKNSIEDYKPHDFLHDTETHCKK